MERLRCVITFKNKYSIHVQLTWATITVILCSKRVLSQIYRREGVQNKIKQTTTRLRRRELQKEVEAEEF